MAVTLPVLLPVHLALQSHEYESLLVVVVECVLRRDLVVGEIVVVVEAFNVDLEVVYEELMLVDGVAVAVEGVVVEEGPRSKLVVTPNAINKIRKNIPPRADKYPSLTCDIIYLR